MPGDGEGEGDAFLLAATDMLLVSLLPRSIECWRNDERDLDLVGMIVIVIVLPRPEVDDGILDVTRLGSKESCRAKVEAELKKKEKKKKKKKKKKEKEKLEEVEEEEEEGRNERRYEYDDGYYEEERGRGRERSVKVEVNA